MKKPKLLLTISNKEQLSLVADGFIVGYERFTSFGAYRFSYEELKEISKEKVLFILLNSLIHEDNLQELKNVVDELCKLDVSFIVQDLATLKYIRLNYPNETVIFNPYTMICNQNDLITYNEVLDVAVSITSNLSLKEKIDLVNAGRTSLLIYGTYPIYQSYRKVISLYENYKNVKIDKNESLFLKEETRNDLYPIIENEYGSFIFSHQKIDLLDFLSELSNSEYFIINTFNCDDEEINDVINKIKVFYE